MELELWEAKVAEGNSNIFETLIAQLYLGNTPEQLATLIQGHPRHIDNCCPRR